MQTEEKRVITGNTEDEVWTQLSADLARQEDLLYYEALIDQHGRQTKLVIDIDPGGGFEGGYATTSFSADVPVSGDFKLAIHKEHFLDKAGKLFGMQDVVLGYPEFDKQFIVKTSDEARIRSLFSNEALRADLLAIDDFVLHIVNREVEGQLKSLLELELEEGITDPAALRLIYRAFYNVLTHL